MDYGSPGVNKGLVFAECLLAKPNFETRINKILCVGAGNGYEVVKFLSRGYDTYSLELYHPRLPILSGRQIQAYAQDMPFKDKEFDLIFCCEMMEHIPEEITEQILLECKRVSGEVCFSIATRDDPPFNTHINIHNAQWWMDKFEELGFKVKNAQKNPVVFFIAKDRGDYAIPMQTEYPDGVLINANC